MSHVVVDVEKRPNSHVLTLKDTLGRVTLASAKLLIVRQFKC